VPVRWEPSLGRLTWPMGSVAQLFSGDHADGLRGPEHHFAWCDELAKWRQADAAWDNLQMGLRAGPRPRALVTTTPRPMRLLERIRADQWTVTTGGTTRDNVSLPKSFGLLRSATSAISFQPGCVLLGEGGSSGGFRIPFRSLGFSSESGLLLHSQMRLPFALGGRLTLLCLTHFHQAFTGDYTGILGGLCGFPSHLDATLLFVPALIRFCLLQQSFRFTKCIAGMLVRPCPASDLDCIACFEEGQRDFRIITDRCHFRRVNVQGVLSTL